MITIFLIQKIVKLISINLFKSSPFVQLRLARVQSLNARYLRMYAKHKDMDLGEFSVEVDFHSNREQQERIERRVIFKQPISQELQEKLLNVCSKTPVTKTLLRSLDIEIVII